MSNPIGSASYARRLISWIERRAKINAHEFVSYNLWLTGGRIASIVTGLGLTTAFANLLAPEAFGTYKYILAASGIVSAFGLNGLQTAIARAVASGKESAVPSAVYIGIISTIPASAVSLGIGVYYLAHGANLLGYSFIIIALTNSISNGFGYAKSMLVSKGDFRTSTLINIPRSIIPVVLLIAVVLLTRNVLYVVAAYFIMSAIASWSLYLVQARILRIRSSSAHVRETIRYGWHLSILGFFLLIGGQIDQLLLWHFTGAAALAVYGIARAPVNELANQLGNFLAIAFPRFVAKSSHEIKRSLRLRMIQMLGASFVLGGLYILFAPLLFSLLFPKYLSSVPLTQCLAVLLLFQPKGLIDTALTAQGHVRNKYIVAGIQQASAVILYSICIPFYGIWGAVGATIGIEAMTALALFITYQRL